jgi:GT2 family glycosyltransferase
MPTGSKFGATYKIIISSFIRTEQISESVSSITKFMSDDDDIIVFGDFNRPDLDFIAVEDNENIFWPCNISNSVDETFLDTFLNNDI